MRQKLSRSCFTIEGNSVQLGIEAPKVLPPGVKRFAKKQPLTRSKNSGYPRQSRRTLAETAAKPYSMRLRFA
jgi:hypothetical protein